MKWAEVNEELRVEVNDLRARLTPFRFMLNVSSGAWHRCSEDRLSAGRLRTWCGW